MRKTLSIFELTENPSDSSMSWTGSIHGNITYQSFSPHFNWTTIIALVPMIYYIPTFVVVFLIFQTFFRAVFSNKNLLINLHVFTTISLAQLTVIFYTNSGIGLATIAKKRNNILIALRLFLVGIQIFDFDLNVTCRNFSFQSIFYFLADYMMLRLPATGFFTSWCAKTEPNQYLKLIFFFTFYFNYSTMIFPLILSLIRLIMMIYPNNHNRINSIFLKFAIPFCLTYPILFTFFLIPSDGYCRQLDGPYPFGSVSIYYHGTLFNMRNSFFHLANTVFWLIASLIANLFLFIRLKSALSRNKTLQQNNSRSRRAEASLTLTVIAMVMPYLTYCIFTVIYLTIPAYTYHMMIMRPFGSDCEAVIVPWTFYLTHPVFKRNDSKKPSAVTIVPMSMSRMFTPKRN